MIEISLTYGQLGLLILWYFLGLFFSSFLLGAAKSYFESRKK